MVMLTLAATLIIPLLALAAGMKLHDRRQAARCSPWTRPRLKAAALARFRSSPSTRRRLAIGSAVR
jgi:hypothetical protein